MSELDIKNWLNNISATVANKDFDAHMALISKNVVVYGMPSGKTLNYTDWHKRRKSEFKRHLLKNLAFNDLKIKTIAIRRIIFTVQEVMDAHNGDIVIINKEIVLEKEQDDHWRVVEETIKNWKHTKAKAHS